MPLFDAHNHLQDERFAGRQDALVRECRARGIAGMVVNGSCEADWAAVATLARAYPDFVQPAFGLHPWYLGERSSRWKDALQRHLDEFPGASVGEIGVDRWILDCPPAAREAVAPGLGSLTGPALPEQVELFAEQLALAAERRIPASIHCLQAWGALDQVLRQGPRPERGFLLHSYGGPAEMVGPLAGLGAYFSFPGYFLHARKARQREAFRKVPADRLLIETDAPDQRLPEAHAWTTPPPGVPESAPLGCPGADDRSLNHPANLPWIGQGLATVLDTTFEQLAPALARNHRALFGAPGL